MGLTLKKVIRGGLILTFSLIGMMGALFLGVVSILKSSDAYKI